MIFTTIIFLFTIAVSGLMYAQLLIQATTHTSSRWVMASFLARVSVLVLICLYILHFKKVPPILSMLLFLSTFWVTLIYKKV